MKIIDLYIGFEGYPEIILTEESILPTTVLFKIKLLEFHFNEVLSCISLGEYDTDSVIYNYFSSSGWFDGKWECKRVQEFLTQLASVQNLPTEYSDVYDALNQIFHSALNSGNKLFIELE
jgi:hypothetical protein